MSSERVVFPAGSWTTCRVCGDDINVDDPVCWATVDGARRVVCESCAPEAEERW